MIWLFLSIITNTILLLLLKGFQRYGISTSQAIVCNYFTTSMRGWYFADTQLTTVELMHLPWSFLQTFTTEVSWLLQLRVVGGSLLKGFTDTPELMIVNSCIIPFTAWK